MSVADVKLRRLVRRPEIAALLDVLAGGEGLAIHGADGTELRAGPAGDGPIPVEVDGSVVGTVAGSAAPMVAVVLGALVAAERDRRVLGEEVLSLYREINVLYALADRLAAARGRDDLAAAALAEAVRLVPSDSAAFVVGDDVHGELDGPPPAPHPARIVAEGAGARLVAPMGPEDGHLGSFVLRRRSRDFSAAELKLVGAVASQAGAALERVLQAERARADALAREERLQRQIEELRIELDERRQAEQVQRITDTDFFARLRAEGEELRRMFGS